MGREFRECPDGVTMENNHVNQVILALNGKQGQGVPLRATEVTDPDLYAVDARNHGSGGKHYRATHSSGSPVLFEVTDDGVALSVAGEAATNPFFFPGMIVAWYGLSTDIPAGWSLCDGTNGTPDLRDRFIVGAGSTYALDEIGGAATANLAHVHPVDLNHDHASVNSGTAGGGAGTSEDGDAIVGTFQQYSLTPHFHTVNLPALGVTPVDSSSAGSLVQDIRPPYLGLYYIMRIAA